MLHFAEELIRPTLLAVQTRERRSVPETIVRELLAGYADETVTDVLDLLQCSRTEGKAASTSDCKIRSTVHLARPYHPGHDVHG